jgi:hypothetical protein
MRELGRQRLQEGRAPARQERRRERQDRVHLGIG